MLFGSSGEYISFPSGPGSGTGLAPVKGIQQRTPTKRDEEGSKARKKDDPTIWHPRCFSQEKGKTNFLPQENYGCKITMINEK